MRRILCSSSQPHFDYVCSALYLNLSVKWNWKKLKIKIQISQNKCIRFCLQLHKMSHISQNKYGTVSWLPIEERYEWCINSIAFKYFNNQCINYLNEVFIKAPKSSLSLRNSYQKRQQPFRKTSTGENAFSFIDPTLWNKIPKETKRPIYINTFKHNLTKFYLKNW